MSLTKKIHTELVQTTLDYCDREGLEFREFIGSRLSGDYPEGCAQEWALKVMSFAPSNRRVNGQWVIDVRKFLQFYYDQSKDMVASRKLSDGWTDEGWNEEANDLWLQVHPLTERR